MKKFEYKVLTFGYGMIPDEKRLNELGQSGWELTGMIVDSEKKISNFFFKKEVDQNRLKQDEMKRTYKIETRGSVITLYRRRLSFLWFSIESRTFCYPQHRIKIMRD